MVLPTVFSFLQNWLHLTSFSPLPCGCWLWWELKVVCNSTLNGLRAKTLGAPVFLHRWLNLMHWMRWVVGQVNGSLHFPPHPLTFLFPNIRWKQSGSSFRVGGGGTTDFPSFWALQLGCVHLCFLISTETDDSSARCLGVLMKLLKAHLWMGDARLCNRHSMWLAVFRKMASVLQYEPSVFFFLRRRWTKEKISQS